MRTVPGSGSIFYPEFDTRNYSVSKITVINGGSGYISTDPPKITITGTTTPISEGVFYPIIDSGSIVSVRVVDPGSGYFPIGSLSGNKIGIETTSKVEEIFTTKDYGGGIILSVSGGIGSAIFENGYNVAISTSIIGVSTQIPNESSRIYGFGTPILANSTTGIGTGARFEVWITYDGGPTGNPISTSIILKDGGRGYSVGDTVSIAGTYLGGITPTNDLSFNVSKVSSTTIVSAANSTFTGVSGTTLVGSGYGVKFDISRDSSGKISSVQVVDGGRYYGIGNQQNSTLTDIISIAGTSIGGSTPEDNLYVSPTLLGTDILPEVLYVDKLDENRFRVSGISTSETLKINNYGTGINYLKTEDPNSSSLIAIDNIIQTPLYGRGINLSLSEPIGLGDVVHLSSGISSLTSLDILSIGDELMKVKSVGIGSTNSVTVERASYGTLVAIHTIGSPVNVLRGDYNISEDKIYFVDPPYGDNHQLNSSFSGRVFSRKFDGNDPSDKNLIIDDISNNFTGKAVTVGIKTGTLNSLYKNKITGISTLSLGLGDVFNLQFTESTYISNNTIVTSIGDNEVGISPNHNVNVGIATTTFSITRLNYILKSNGDNVTSLYSNTNNTSTINNNPIILINNIPQIPDVDYIIDTEGNNTIKFINGIPNSGRISNVSINTGYGYQPLVGASATVKVSSAGTISEIYLNGSGSGYTTAPIISITSTVGVGATIVASIGLGGTITTLNIVNSGSGYTSNILPTINIPPPTGYSNLGVAYTGGISGTGEGARVSVSVGNSSNIIDFSLDSPGYGYKVGDILTPVGIVTNPLVGIGFSEFRIVVTEVFSDKFSGFYPGQFIKLDDISSFFNGTRRKFDITKTTNGIKDTFSVRVDPNSDLKSENNYFIFINSILQNPSNSYVILGSKIIFTEAPKKDSKCLILYYNGSNLNVEQIDPPKTIKEGDLVKIGINVLNPYDVEQYERVVKKIVSPEELDTFPYDAVGINTDLGNSRPLTWTKQTRDRIINGVLYSKSRPDLKSRNTPVAKLIKSVSTNDNVIYIDNAFPLFVEDSVRGMQKNLRNAIILDNNLSEPALGKATVSFSSSVSNIEVTNFGSGYKSNPVVAISSSLIINKDPIYNFYSVSGINTNYEINSIVYGNSSFIGVGSSSVLIKSADGKSWVIDSVGYGNSITFNSVSFAGTNTYVAVGQTGTIIRSTIVGTQMSTWDECKLINKTIDVVGGETTFDSNYDGEFKSIVYTNTKNTYVAVGKTSKFDGTSPIFVAVGVAATEFFEQNKTNTKNLNSIETNGDMFVAVGDNGTIYSSTDAVIWTITQKTSQNLNKVIWNGSKFIAIGNNSTIITSKDGLSWSIVNDINIIENFTNISYYGGIYVCLVENQDVYYSFDLSNWEKRSTNQSNIIKDLKFVPSLESSGRYVFVGSGGTVFYSDPTYNVASAVASITNGVVSSVNIVNGGFGYSQINTPPIIFSHQKPNREKIQSFDAKGDFGTLIGINTVGIGTSSLEFVLKSETYDNSVLGVGYSSLNTFGIFNSQLELNDYFLIYDSNVTSGYALTGLTTSTGVIVGTSKSFIDGVYKVEGISVPSAGIVTVRCNFIPVPGGIDKSINVGTSATGFYGRYTWGKIYNYQNRARENPKDFIVNTNDGLIGISTSAEIYRTRGLI